MAGPPAPPVEVDLRPFNDPRVLRSGRVFLLLCAVACFVLATITGLIPFARTADGVKGAFGYAGEGTILPLAVVLAGVGPMLVITSFGRGTELATSASVDDAGLVLLYPSGRRTVFRWVDDGLRLRFVDYVALPGGPYKGQRRIEVWRPFVGRTNVPPEFLARILERARSQGVAVATRPGPAGRSTIIEFSRTTPVTPPPARPTHSAVRGDWLAELRGREGALLPDSGAPLPGRLLP
jgi:hypothetical protein